jgi:hypothetical protein
MSVLSKQLSNLIDTYLKASYIPWETISNNEKEFHVDLQAYLSTRSYVVVSTFEFIGSIKSSLELVDTNESFWYHPRAHTCEGFLPDKNNTKWLLNFYLKSEEGLVKNLRDKYSYSIDILENYTYLHPETYGKAWWCLDCPIESLKLLTRPSIENEKN